MANKQRRANGEGSIRLRSDGRWEARYSLGFDDMGRQISKSIYGKSQKDVRQKLTQVLNDLDKGTYTPPARKTVHEWMQEWLETYCANKLKPYTMTTYQGIVANHIDMYLGGMQLQAVRGFHVQRMYNSMIGGGASPKTVKNVSAVLHKACDVAVKQGLMSVNPCDAAELPAMKQHEIHPLADSEIPLFLDAIKGDPLENAYALCLFVALREGECLGLTWDRVNLDTGELLVCQQLQKEKTKGGQYSIVPFTKSNKPRTITLPTVAVEYLRNQHHKQQEWEAASLGLWNNPDDLVFTNEIGRHVAIFTFYARFKKIAASIGRPDLRPHDLRHTAATVAISTGSDVKSVQDMLGHATASFTLTVYAHSSEKMRQDTAARLQDYYSDMMRGKNSKNGKN